MTRQTSRWRTILTIASPLAAAATLVIAGCQQPEPTPTPVPPTSTPVRPMAEWNDPCGPMFGRDPQEHQHFLHWAGDSTHLVFDADDTIWALDVEQGQLRQIADADADYTLSPQRVGSRRFVYGFYADVHPDGNQIVYSTCEYLHDPPLASDPGEVTTYSEGYEIAKVDLDGTGHERLTRDRYFQNYPVWSPDGSQVAFVAGGGPNGEYNSSIYDDGADSYGIAFAAPNPRGASPQRLEWRWARRSHGLFPPVWSPDGKKIALTLRESEGRPLENVVYVGTIDRLHNRSPREVRIGKATTLPTWSPNGEELAFAAFEGTTAITYIVTSDGSDKRELWRATPGDGAGQISQLSWSPDGSEMLIVTDETYLLDIESGEARRLEDLPSGYDGVRPVAWSPDGSRIAIYNPDRGIVTVSPDGTELRTLMGINANGQPDTIAGA